MPKTTFDRNELKSLLRELLTEEPEIVINALRTLSKRDERGTGDGQTGIGEDELKSIVKRDFADLEAVFRALA